MRGRRSIEVEHGPHVECRPDPEAAPQRRRRTKDDYMMFVFGDSFVDAGNSPTTTDKTAGRSSRQWFYPYGSSDSAHGNRATGRLSNGLMQSDFLGTCVCVPACC